MDFSVRGLCKRYGDHVVLENLDLDFVTGKVSVVLGPSGCGKTSLLNILAGLDRDYGGSTGDFARSMASCVFQEDRLLPWLDARGNVAFALSREDSLESRLAQADRALREMGLEEYSHASPSALSGGMKRRVALARAFASKAPVMLLDEPFSSLDLRTRIAVMDSFLDQHARDGRTTIVVTHDVREALYLGDTIITLSEKPARVRDILPVSLARGDRSYTSDAAAHLETRLYESILG